MTHSPGPTQCVLDCAGMLRTLVTLLHHDVSHCESNLHVSRMPTCEQGGHKGQGPRTTTHGHNQSAGRPVFVGHEMGPCQPASFGTTTTQPQCTSLVLCLRVESTEKLQDERRPHQRRLHPSNEKEQVLPLAAGSWYPGCRQTFLGASGPLPFPKRQYPWPRRGKVPPAPSASALHLRLESLSGRLHPTGKTSSPAPCRHARLGP